MTTFLLILLPNILIQTLLGLDNGLARTPPMGWDTYNGFHGAYDDQLLMTMADLLISTGMKDVGYNRINLDGGWAWVIQEQPKVYVTQRNDSGYILPDPAKFPDGIEKPINYIHSLGLKYGHYTNAGVNACGNALNSSEYWMEQDISQFAAWKIDMLKVDNCNVEGNDTEIIFEWRDMLNATGRPILFSNCRNQCMNDADHKRTNWEPWCVNLSNTWRISTDINPGWGSMLHNLDCGKSFGQWNQPGAWTDLDLMEVDIGNFKYSGYNPTNSTLKQMRLMMNEAFFSLWCITSAPLMAGNDLRNMDEDILNLLTNKYAVGVNQNYLNHGGDVIIYFNITDTFRQQYINEMMKNGNQTEMFYKPLPKTIGNAAFVFLNRNETNYYSMSVDFNQLPLTNDHNNSLECDALDIWNKTTMRTTKFSAMLYPQSVKFILLSNCSKI